ncbi:MAG: rubrerythrin [Candidatus Fischerbacteria bacterium RBG_13_37_8]|uniref:Rubrerythrin n=1 Tax=Candidatus Fischerbacteria bacterium RBG_13_37_8 TaxID=1817863 RepID=A0A1F5VMQ6_9BACT|nr:MAG: rubrerythrin [Candidatus Fischerbacteria bacterium RBG_13_37_8]
MDNIKGSRTERNLLTAFAGESQGRNRYTFYSLQAKNEGLHQIAEAFSVAADNEREHARKLYSFLGDSRSIEIKASFPANAIGTTKENLESAIAGEKMEYEVVYPEFAQIAQEEGFKDIAEVFLLIAEIEKYHEKRFSQLLRNLESNRLYIRERVSKWQCTNCGYVHEVAQAPDNCALCEASKSYFTLLYED